MKPSTILLAACAMLTATAARAGDPAVFTPIHAIEAAFNKGDFAAAAAAHVAAPTIVDNVAPFRWSGPGAFDKFLNDLGAAEAAAGKTGGAVSFGAPVDEVVSGDRAYLVTPCSYIYTQNGKKMRETGFTAFTLVKVGAAWKVEGWSWASPKAVAVVK
jgi:hypothetical protein